MEKSQASFPWGEGGSASASIVSCHRKRGIFPILYLKRLLLRQKNFIRKSNIVIQPKEGGERRGGQKEGKKKKKKQTATRLIRFYILSLCMEKTQQHFPLNLGQGWPPNLLSAGPQAGSAAHMHFWASTCLSFTSLLLTIRLCDSTRNALRALVSSSIKWRYSCTTLLADFEGSKRSWRNTFSIKILDGPVIRHCSCPKWKGKESRHLPDIRLQKLGREMQINVAVALVHCSGARRHAYY